MPFNMADMFEFAVEAVPDREALVEGDDRLTYAELDERVNRLANHLIDQGLEPGAHVGVYGPNSIEWVEAMMASFDARLVPVNINYRYVEDELRYLFDNADLQAVVYQREYGPRIAAVRDSVPTLRHLIMIDDGSDAPQDGLDFVTYDDALASGKPSRPDVERSPDDQFIIYTGGTTGMPKGVMWRQEDIFFSLAGGIDAFSRERVPHERFHAENARNSGGPLTFLIAPPLMHGAAQVCTVMNLLQGNRLVLMRKFDPEGVWRLIEREGINSILITGDAMGRPMVEALEDLEARGEELDLSSLLSLSSSAAVFSPTVKDRYLARFPNLVITDSIGSTESGFNGLITVGKGNTAMKGGGPTVAPGRDSVVLDETTLEPVAPGSGVVGKLGRGGNIPLGYYKDEAKTRETFVVAADGKRYAVPGDWATVEDDGSITLLGRGSVCINSGGEKIYPEEVEQALKAHADVFDALVVGVADDRWGQRVAAVVQPRDGHDVSLEALDQHCRGYVAGFKVPRELHVVDEIRRSPAGKPDYPWAKELAESGSHRVAP
jgi:acyl-CoA synthetase (AMP-forming)/AMP-acid ligase II